MSISEFARKEALIILNEGKGGTTIIIDEAENVSPELLEQLQLPMTTKETNPKDGIGILKPSYHAVPVPVLYELGAALTEGACKYGGYNWRVAGVRTSVYIAATRRHIDSFWEGEDIDPDSGLSHITKAIASLTVLRDAQLNDMVKNDDRPPSIRLPFMECVQERFDEINKRHPNPKPPYTQVELQHKRNTPVSIYAGQTLGFEVEVMLPADDAPEGFVWAQQGGRRTDLDQTLAVAQALRDDGYGERVIRVTRVADRVELMSDDNEYVAGEMRVIIITVFPGDASLMEASEEEIEEDNITSNDRDGDLPAVLHKAFDHSNPYGECAEHGTQGNTEEDECDEYDSYDIGGEG